MKNTKHIKSETTYGPKGNHEYIAILILFLMFIFPFLAVFLHWLFN